MACWTRIYPDFAKSVDPDQLAPDEANWSRSALFAIEYVNLYQLSGLMFLIGWKLEVDVASYIYSAEQGLKGRDTLGRLSDILYKRDNFCNFLFVILVLYINLLLQRGLPRGAKTPSF